MTDFSGRAIYAVIPNFYCFISISVLLFARLLQPVYLVEPFSLNYFCFSVYFNAIAIQWVAICPTSCIRCIAVFSDLLPVFLPLVIVPFFRLVPLVIVVVPFCVFSQSEMLNASLISSFIRLVSTTSSFNRLVSTTSSFNRLVSTISSFIRLVSTLPCLLTWVCLFFVLFFGTLL